MNRTVQKTLSLGVSLVILCVLTACRNEGDYHAILALRDRIQADPNDSKALERLLNYLPSNHWLDPGNAAACFRQLAESPDNKQRVVPVIAPRVVPALVKNIEHVGREATNALTEYGDYVLPYKADLIATIQKHPHEDIAWFAAEALGNLGPNAADALPIIQSMPIYETNRDLIEDAIKNIQRTR
ncbi:MAG TPA: hypothetical protein VF614_01450 [Chthoniobacteraceae bacterium]